MADNNTPEAVEVNKVDEQVPAQVAPARDPEKDTVDVRETSVRTDYVVTDPTSDLAVQVPDEGKGSLDLPANALDAPSPEQTLAGSGSKSESKPESKPAPAAKK